MVWQPDLYRLANNFLSLRQKSSSRLPFAIQFIVVKFKELIGRSKCVLLLKLDKTSVFPIRTSEHDSLSTMQNRPRLIIFKSESLSLSVPICFYVFSVGWSQTALLFPAFYDYRAKLTSLGSGEERRGETKIAILTSDDISLVKHQSKVWTSESKWETRWMRN